MFEVVFIEQIVKLGNSHGNAEKRWNEIASEYQQARRFYHTLQHLEHMFLNILEVKNEINDWQSIIFSIAFHDVIYDPLRNDNEERSAAFAETQLSQAGSPISQVEKCKEQILATKAHQPSVDADINYFTDADLAILGADPEEYSSYASDIRKEYSHYPDPIYNAGRKKVLMHFLHMPQIFKTEHFNRKYGSQAIINLKDELQKCS
jgi:predicted metal-dependent HD superfamily phosphohydrolase